MAVPRVFAFHKQLVLESKDIMALIKAGNSSGDAKVQREMYLIDGSARNDTLLYCACQSQVVLRQRTANRVTSCALVTDY